MEERKKVGVGGENMVERKKKQRKGIDLECSLNDVTPRPDNRY